MPHYDLVIIGSGSGNTLIDERFDALDIALVDDGPTFGGTCLNRGCIPTKMYVYPADLVSSVEDAARVDVAMARPVADFDAVRDRTFGRIDAISAGGEEWRAQASNVTLYRATGRFATPGVLRVGDEELTADRWVIAAGSRPEWPDIDGLDALAEAGLAHTSDTIMRLDARPERLLIVGSGFIAAEFAHIFEGFGTQVTMLARGERVLRKEDAEVSARFTRELARRVDLVTAAAVESFAIADGAVRAQVTTASGRRTIDADAVLIATGRRPNGDRLGCEAGGITLDERGYVVVDDQQRTSAEGVFALGDVCSPWQLKHVANAEARTVAHNLLHSDDPRTTDHRFVPHAVFSRPEIAAVGLTEQQARERGLDVAVTVQEYASVAYGWAMNDETGFVKLVADKATKQLVGAHIMGHDAPNLIQPLIQAMSLGTDVETMARGQYWIHPALTEVIENALLSLDLG